MNFLFLATFPFYTNPFDPYTSVNSQSHQWLLSPNSKHTQDSLLSWCPVLQLASAAHSTQLTLLPRNIFFSSQLFLVPLSLLLYLITKRQHSVDSPYSFCTPLPLKVWHPDKYHQHQLRIYWKCKFSGLTKEPLNQRLWERIQKSVFHQALQEILTQPRVWDPLLESTSCYLPLVT